jgi:phosphate transport system substrate-binding protein
MIKILTTALIGFSVATAAAANDIRIVGSSTVFPFASAVVEQFHNKTGKNATIESTGSGGGFKLFCAGVDDDTPSITNASRRIKDKEVKLCRENGVDQVTEYKIGYDGIVLLNATNSYIMNVTREDIFRALNSKVNIAGEVTDNPYSLWSDIRPELPEIVISVMGPPPSSGTRDAFEELVMEPYAEENGVDVELREDGAYIEAGENDNIIIDKLAQDDNLFGIVGFSYLDQNGDVVKGAIIDGVEPTYDNIADGKYLVSRSLWFYVKNDHEAIVSGLRDYVNEFTSEATWGPDGYLADYGLISLPDSERVAPDFGKNNGPFVN